jgi:hypothetical protein
MVEGLPEEAPMTQLLKTLTLIAVLAAAPALAAPEGKPRFDPDPKIGAAPPKPIKPPGLPPCPINARVKPRPGTVELDRERPEKCKPVERVIDEAKPSARAK